MIITGY